MPAPWRSRLPAQNGPTVSTPLLAPAQPTVAPAQPGFVLGPEENEAAEIQGLASPPAGVQPPANVVAPFRQQMAQPDTRLAWLASQAAYELRTPNSPCEATLVAEGFVPIAVNGADSTIAMFWNQASSLLLLGFRGTVPRERRDRNTDYLLAMGRLSYTERASTDRAALKRALASFAATSPTAMAQRVIFAGHSLGGTLAVEFLSNVWCNNGPAAFVQHPDVKKTAIVFNPGWAVAPKHYQFFQNDLVQAITVFHISGDRLSAFIATPPKAGVNQEGLRARLHQFHRIYTHTLPGNSSPLQKHSLNTFKQFLVHPIVAFSDGMPGASAQVAPAGAQPPAQLTPF